MYDYMTIYDSNVNEYARVAVVRPISNSTISERSTDRWNCQNITTQFHVHSQYAPGVNRNHVAILFVYFP